MADNADDRAKDEPSLELPTLALPGLGRRRRRRGSAPDGSSGGRTPESAQGRPGPTTGPATKVVPDAGTHPEDAPDTGARPEDAPGAAPAGAPKAASEPTAPAPAALPATAPRPRRRRGGRRAGTSAAGAPALPTPLAAAVTGAVVGALGALATYLGIAACDAIRGAGTCGGPGILVLVGIFALMVVLGSTLLRTFRVGDPGSTSFLAVGLMAVAAFLVLLDAIFSVWMFAVVPAVGAVAFLAATWVTGSSFADER